MEAYVAGFPRVFQEARLAKLRPELERILREWTSGRDHRPLLSTGPTSRGKTHAAYALARHWAEAGPDTDLPQVVNVLEWVVAERARATDPVPVTPLAAPTAERLATTPSLVILDDLGACRCTECVIERLYRVLYERESEALPTLVTSNLDLSRIADTLDPRLASRLGGGVVIEFTGPDWRLARRE